MEAGDRASEREREEREKEGKRERETEGGKRGNTCLSESRFGSELEGEALEKGAFDMILQQERYTYVEEKIHVCIRELYTTTVSAVYICTYLHTYISIYLSIYIYIYLLYLQLHLYV